ncbi:hypothetical protein ACFQO4_19320 [Saliphagus sp. GCM10025334]|uniref:hypothetical protein n=1 Tax=Natronosalvus caseinilyticus TaxID=2953747 RepID=UPI0028AF0CAA|nr:hypothetical protein [Natronosalvus caseinilyticus]
MNRRKVLTGISTGALLGVGGCLETDTSFLDETSDDSGDGNSVPGCTQKETWSDGGNATPEDPDPASIAGRHDCSSTRRPEPTGEVCTTFTPVISGEERTIHSAGIEPYPEPPSSFDEETLVSYVSEYENAYFHNSMVEKYRDELRGAGIRVEEDETRIKQTENAITLVYIRFFTSTSTLSDGTTPSVGDGAGAAGYGIDETGIVRTEARYSVSEEEMPDPVESGTLLECF